MTRSITTKILTLLVAPALLLSFTLPADKVNFSGTWKLNEGKSELGNFGRFAVQKIVVSQKDNEIEFAKTSPSFSGGDDVTVTQTLSYDGKVTEATVFGSSKMKSTAKWSDDGKSMVVSYTIDFERNGQITEIKGTETWTLSGDGKTLTLDNASSSAQGERKTKAVYDKE